MLNKLPSLIKPTLKTKFHIDFDWWKTQDRNWRATLISYLCTEHQQKFVNLSGVSEMDLVDLNTGEVTRGDGLLYILETHCSKQPDFISETASLVDTIFKVFLANHNKAFTPEDLSKLTGRPADIILRTIGTTRVYKGIRPI